MLKKFLISAAILGILALVVVFLAKSPAPPEIQVIVPEKIEKSQLQVSETQPLNLRIDPSRVFNTPEAKIPFVVTDPNNVTERVVLDVVQEVILSGGQPPTDQQINERILSIQASALENIDLNLEVDTSALTIRKSVTDEEWVAFYVSWAEIITEHFSYFQTPFSADNAVGGLSSRLAAINKTLESFFALPVPNNFVPFYKDQIRLLTIQEKAIAPLVSGEINVAADPLRAIPFIQTFSDAHDEFTGLIKTIINSSQS